MTKRRKPNPVLYPRQVLVRITEAQYQGIIDLAAANERTMAAELRRAIRAHLGLEKS